MPFLRNAYFSNSKRRDCGVFLQMRKAPQNRPKKLQNGQDLKRGKIIFVSRLWPALCFRHLEAFCLMRMRCNGTVFGSGGWTAAHG
jgi:hypothetical protein